MPKHPLVFSLVTFGLAATTALAEPSDVFTDAKPALALEKVTPVSADTAQSGDVDLKEIAASDPNLSLREGEGDAPDAMVMLSDVLFEFGTAKLAPAAIETLESVAKKLDGVSDLKITGHTDAIGSEDTNLALGMDRAESVRNWLISSGYLDAEAISVDSAGEASPIAANVTENGGDNPEGRALNRRVEFSIVEQPKEAAAPEEVTALNTTPHPTVF